MRTVGVSAVGGTVENTCIVGMAGSTWSVLLVDNSVAVTVVLDGEAERSWADVTVAEDEKSTEDWLGEQVKDTVEDSLAVNGDDVATLAHTPSNWVEHPEEGSQATAHEEGTAGLGADSVGVDASLPDEDVHNPEESEAAKDEVSPLVAAGDQSTNETGDDHNLVDQDSPENGRGGHASGEEQVKEQERSGNDPSTLLALFHCFWPDILNIPIDVSNVVDLTARATNDRVAALELNLNGDPSQVRCESEVGDGCNHDNTGGDVVEDTVMARLGERQAHEAQHGNSHAGADSPVPVGAMGSQGLLRRGSVPTDGVVCTMFSFLSASTRRTEWV